MASSGRLSFSTTPTTGSPRKKFQETFTRTPQGQKMLFSDILHSQQTDVKGELADTQLICHGGIIRVHAFILQAASTFIRDALASQGENYPHVRLIMLPDFPVKEIEKMLSLIYKGYVDLRTDKEAKRLQETLKFFQVSGVDFSTEKFEKMKGSLKVQDQNRIPSDLKAESGSGSDYNVKAIDRKKASKTESPASENLRRSGRVTKPIMQLDKGGADPADGNDSDYKADPGDESSVEEASGDEGPSRKRGKPAGKLMPVVKLPRIMNAGQRNAVGSSSSAVVINPRTTSNIVGAKSADKEDSGTDTEDEGWEKPNFKDKDWFCRESRRCQSCNKTFEKPAEASLCITSHKCLRCYFCFKVYSTTDILFKHFRRRHKQAGREATLICPFCDQAIPYKSVSCHVISVHLRTKPDNENKPAVGYKSPIVSPPTTSKYNEAKKGAGRPPSISSTPTSGGHVARRRSRSASTERPVSGSSSERNPSKKVKNSASPSPTQHKKKKGPLLTFSSMDKMLKNGKSDQLLTVPDLDVTVEKVMANGKTLIFRLQKKRLDDEDNPPVL